MRRPWPRRLSSAGNTRGLIEAPGRLRRHGAGQSGLPRGIPAASLKLSALPLDTAPIIGSSAGNTRGLIEATACARVRLPSRLSSAGNTRGLIEALGRWQEASVVPASSAGNTRGLIEASSSERWFAGRSLRLPRGIPAASLSFPGRPHSSELCTSGWALVTFINLPTEIRRARRRSTMPNASRAAGLSSLG